MAAVPHFTPSSTALPPGAGTGAAAILRFRRCGPPSPVAPDPCEGRQFMTAARPPSQIAAGWTIVLALAVLGLALS